MRTLENPRGFFILASEQFLPERVALLYRLSGSDAPLVLLVAAVGAFAVWDALETRLLVAWAAWLVAGSVTRVVLRWTYRRASPLASRAARWENIFCLAAALLGTAWGAALLVLRPQPESAQEMIITFAISCISMGLPSSLAPSPKVFVAFMLPILAPAVSVLFTSGGGLQTSAGLLVLLFSALLLVFYISAHRALISALSYAKQVEGELMAAIQREKEMNEMKSRFVSMASHEFRTPLSGILSSAELLEQFGDKLDGPEKAELLDGITRSVKRLNSLVTDVLVVGRSTSGKLRFGPAPVDLRDICNRAASEARAGDARAHDVQVDFTVERQDLEMDEQLLLLILNNLLSNAAKYSPPQSTISLKVAEQADDIRFEVTDRGIGIPLEDQARLFTSFYRASNVGQRPGTGLGLTIVKTAAETHGGSIAVDSRPGEGTTFTVTLPAKPATEVQVG